MKLLDNAIAVMFLSFIVGMVIDSILRTLPIYERLSSLYLFTNPKSYERLGVLWYRRFLLATPLRLFNTQIRFTKFRDLETLKRIRSHMAAAEVAHWVGFVAMLGVTCVAWWLRGWKVGMAYVLLNLVGNLYPCLLQQFNKRRLHPLIESLERRQTPRSSL